MTFYLVDFVRESNRIEGINRDPKREEVLAHTKFLGLPHPTTKDLEEFVSAIAPGHVLRDKEGLNVRVGNHIAPHGGPEIRLTMNHFLATFHYEDAWTNHVKYETIHPFTDGNGRSGRMLWLWQMRDAPLGFLHTFYYQTLANSK